MDDITLIERMARTLCKIRGIVPDDHHMDFGTQWQAVAREAKGVLICLQDPTEQMLEAGARDARIDPETAERIYRSMIGVNRESVGASSGANSVWLLNGKKGRIGHHRHDQPF